MGSIVFISFIKIITLEAYWKIVISSFVWRNEAVICFEANITKYALLVKDMPFSLLSKAM
jgi:hypothetical protein